MRILVLFFLFCIWFVDIVFAEIFYEEVRTSRWNDQGNFKSYVRDTLGDNLIKFVEVIDIMSYIDSIDRCEEKRKDSELFKTQAEASQYLAENPDTECQKWSIKEVYIRTDQRIRYGAWERIWPYETNESGEVYPYSWGVSSFLEYWDFGSPICVEKEGGGKACELYFIFDKNMYEDVHVFNYEVKYSCVKQKKDGECFYTYANGSFDSMPSQAFQLCDIEVREMGENFTLTQEKTYTYLWDDEPPLCVPAISEWLWDVLYSSEYYSPEDMAQKVWRSTASIIYSNGESWDGQWTNVDLFFKRRCIDGHSGCALIGGKNPTRQAVLEGTPLHNRQTELKMSGEPYKDNVNNVSNGMCSVRFEKLSALRWSCILDTRTGKYSDCKYSFRGYGAGEASYPLIDKINPEIHISPSKNSTIDNPWSSETILGDKWSFYAGRIKFDTNILDQTFNSVSSGISGLKVVAIRIKDAAWNEVFSLSDSIDEDLRRRTDGEMDSVPSEWEVKSIDANIYKTWKYTIEVGVIDYAENISRFKYDFEVIENFNGHKFITKEKSFVDSCKMNVTAYSMPTWCLSGDDVGGYVVIEDMENNDLYADANSNQNVKVAWYDKYFNVLNKRFLIDLHLQKNSEFMDCIPLERVNNNDILQEKTCSLTDNNAIVHRATDSSDVFVNYIKSSHTSWNGEMKIQTFSYAPWIFHSNYEGQIKGWNTHGVNIDNKIASFKIDIRSWDDIARHFYHIFTGELWLSNNKIDLWTENNIWINFSHTNSEVKPFYVYNFLESLQPLQSDVQSRESLQVTSTGQYTNIIWKLPPDWVYNTGTFIIEQIGKEEVFPDNIQIQSIPYVSIKQMGLNNEDKTATYFISHVKDMYGKLLNYDKGDLNRIYIYGHKQSIGKDEYVANNVNLLGKDSKFSITDIRNEIHKNVAYLTRNFSHKTIQDAPINKIKYIENWNIVKLSDIIQQDWNTLIIKDANLLIDRNFNEGNENRAIILVKSEIPDFKKGNIYIAPDVTYIAASIYADWSIMSVDDNGDLFDTSDSRRSKILNKQIVFLGNILSQNTIWWAVKAIKDDAAVYYLPTMLTPNVIPASQDNLYTAIWYDFAFLRMWNEGHENNAVRNQNRKENVVIIANEKYIQDPLPIFDFRE